ncbi:MAG: 5-(carboxyamino)imidazole ribonucleotide synthase [Betaproteobacteria bacterium TMED82]|nr:MAG: 5-(carboxyamino)imidazole ribonucleotide synthase [Betaproteobacteria bacterium TMED82]
MKIGLLGGGQLGMMMIESAKELNIDVIVFEQEQPCPAERVCNKIIYANYFDKAALNSFGKQCDVFTVESENIPLDALRYLSQFGELIPKLESIEIFQDRIKEKNYLKKLDLPVVPCIPILATSQQVPNIKNYFPGILKTAKNGYDGKGQRLVNSEVELWGSFDNFGGVPCILEKKVPLDMELSIISARGVDGEMSSYPLAENKHENGILVDSIMPANISNEIVRQASDYAVKIADDLKYSGVFCIEFFVCNEELLINEIAPRPHNSGHQTIVACDCSQFEQQVRVCAKLPLGETKLSGRAKLHNLLGDIWFVNNGVEKIVEPDWQEYRSKGFLIKLYGKSKVKKGRKMGHLIDYEKFK